MFDFIGILLSLSVKGLDSRGALPQVFRTPIFASFKHIRLKKLDAGSLISLRPLPRTYRSDKRLFF